MHLRLKILISAYACEPGKGSEPEVGWQWGLQLARFHDVTVLTRANNRSGIERELAAMPRDQPVPKFVYHDLGKLQLRLKRTLGIPQLYYIFWQHSAARVIRDLNAKAGFDLLHHLTFAGYRYDTAIWRQGLLNIWGPVGGMESIPFSLLPWRHPRQLCYEVLRNMDNFWQRAPFHLLRARASATSLILASTRETVELFREIGVESLLMPTVGLKMDEVKPRQVKPPAGPLKLLFCGQIIALKGIELALYALRESGTDAVFTLYGDGSFLKNSKSIARRLKMADRVDFRGRVPRATLLDVYANFDVFLFPSLHDSGGFAVLEAMANALPVICFQTGGTGVSVNQDCGRAVKFGSRRETISRLASAIRFYDENRDLVAVHGLAASRRVREEYDWDKKGEGMNAIYQGFFRGGPRIEENAESRNLKLET